MTKKVFVSGCYDMLHSGHVEFFQQAAAYGDLYVALGSDKTVFALKGRVPYNDENERLFMVRAIGCVKNAFVSSGSGHLDFVAELKAIKPDLFVVNEDGNTPAKQKLCAELGVEYVVLRRQPREGLQARSTTSLRQQDRMPYRIDIAGGWLDQPFVSKLHPGAVITVSLEPTVEFNERSGMATSTRRKAVALWGNQLPVGDPHKIAKLLFCYDNPPGTTEFSGAQDTIGLVFPGLARSHYSGEYWPHRIDTLNDAHALAFVERMLHLIPLGPRESGYSVLSNTNITAAGAKALADATDACWNAILAQDARAFGQAFRQSFEAQIAMFPNMVNPSIFELIEQFKDIALGWKISGAGGGGYLILASEQPIVNALRVTVRRLDDE
ncbi:MAG: adenylyltransferase/cytidyltransferase family protein [Anaerolineae bacterium]|nr:adenylyltransferase/cytidyltransferase family protein [Anaerolineae bacterium]